MSEHIIGAQMNDGTLEFYGVDELNALLQQGHRVTKVEPGNIIVEDTESEGEDEEESYAFMGFELNITVEEKTT
ncbi:MAG: hypothetical protein JO316_16985 [Abitibacteriaceae bacterium]|nr:hypothetical protein [Abditibacteriaceae bacterium]